MHRIATFATALILTALPAFAADITIEDAYFRSASPMAKSGAAFMQIINSTGEDDQLLEVSSDFAARVDLHTNIKLSDGVIQMQHMPEGFTIPANGAHDLARGGDHVMFMGLSQRATDGEMITLTLTFRDAGDITVEIPVDSKR